MPVKILRFERGDTLALPSGNGARTLWKVDRRVRNGYVLASQIGEADRLFSHEEIFDAYVAGALESWPCNLSGLDAARAEILQTDLESWPKRKLFEAKCREEYVRRADALRARGVPAKIAYSRAATVVSKVFGHKWDWKLNEINAEERALQSAQRKVKPEEAALSSAPQIEQFRLGEFSVRNWYIQWDKAGKDLRALIAKDHKRGDHRPRKTYRVDQQTDERVPLCVYGAMAWIGRSVWMQVPRVTKTYAHDRLNKLCTASGFESVSYTTFSSFLRTHFTEFEQYRARYGPRAAYLKYHIFERRALPERALEEVEVDHCLLDVFVTDEKSRKARPWLTVLICRATKMILGIHVSFEVPSYSTLSRAIIHAMAVKDLTGTPDVENDWPCHGVFDMLITDRGLEFLSESLQRAARDLKFAIVNLPGRMPHLKATVERFFGSLGVRVLTHIEGTTLSRTDQYYDPQARARYTLAELTAKLVKWIVDDYHYSVHSTLGMPPIQRWKELVEAEGIHGGVRPVGNFSRLVVLMGEPVKRKISNIGIQYDNNIYSSEDLQVIRRRDLDQDVEVLADVTDRGHLWIFDAVAGRWISVPAKNQKISKGLNKFASRIVMRMARKIAGEGEEITDAIMLEARERCEREASTSNSRSALRFCADGAMATNLVGNNDILAVLAGSVPSQPCEEVGQDDQGLLFPDLAALPPRRPSPAAPVYQPADAVHQLTARDEGQKVAPLVEPGSDRGQRTGANSGGADPQQRKPEPAGMGALRSLMAQRSKEMRTLR